MAKKLINNPDDIRLTEQHEIEAIMGNPPGRLLTSGNYLFLGGILLLLALGYFLPYPDVVEAKVKLVSDDPPIRLVPRTSGRLIHFEIIDGKEVSKGDLLAVIDNAAQWEDVLEIDIYLKQQLKNLTVNELNPKNFPKVLNLGEVQTPYAVFINNLETANFNKKNDATSAQLESLDEQIKNYEASNVSLEKRKTEGKAELALVNSNFARIEKSIEAGVASPLDLERIQIQRSQKLQEIELIANQKAANDVAINQLKNQKIDLPQRSRMSQNEYDLKTVAAYENLKSAIHQWSTNYLIVAPISGKISINNLLTINQFVQAGEEIITIIPAHQSVYGLAELGQQNIGKVSLKDSVKIRLAGFPYYDYGSLAGKVEQISSLPDNDFYRIKIVFPKEHLSLKNDSLKVKTSYDKYIPVRQEMEGTASIITEENTYLGRIFNRLRGTFD
jgi:multidrug resistance efflux pump